MVPQRFDHMSNDDEQAMSYHEDSNGSSSDNSQRLQLTIQAKDLKKKSSHSSPYAEVSLVQDGLDRVVLGKTEVIQSCLNPVWMKAFYLQYTIGKPTYIEVRITDDSYVEEAHGIQGIGGSVVGIGSQVGSTIFVAGNLVGSGVLGAGNRVGSQVGNVVKDPTIKLGNFGKKMIGGVGVVGGTMGGAVLGGVGDVVGSALGGVGKAIGGVGGKVGGTLGNSLPMRRSKVEVEFDENSKDILVAKEYNDVSIGADRKSMGWQTFEIGDVLGSNGMKAKKMQQGGTIVVRVRKAPLHSSGNLVISLQGVKLRNFELSGVSDPFFEISRNGESKEQPWIPVFRSNIILDTLDPIWEPASVDLDKLCDGNRDMKILIAVYDFEKNGNHKRMGHFESTVNTLVKEKINENNEYIRSFTLTKDKKSRKDYGMIVVSDAFIETIEGRESNTIDPNKSYLNITLHGMDIKGANDVIFEISRFVNDGSMRLIAFRSPDVNNSSAQWREVSIPMSKLCDNDKDKSFTVSVYNYNVKQKMAKKQIGQFDTTVNELLASTTSDTNDEENMLILLSKGGKNVGKIQAVSASIKKANGEVIYSASTDGNENTSDDIMAVKTSVTDDTDGLRKSSFDSTPNAMTNEDLPEPEFMDYIKGGCEIKLCIAIDFGKSNGLFRLPQSLHKLHSDGKLNDYERAINDIGSILSKYMCKGPESGIPVWGFGAKIGGLQQNCFQLGPKAEASDIKGVLELYRKFFSFKFTMSERSDATDIISNACNFAKWELDDRLKHNEQCYTVLLLLTSGDLKNIAKTKKKIMDAGQCPLSIVIVGIGDGDFSDMHLLDEFMEGTGKEEIRDITQFVEFNAHKSTKNDLTAAVLEEIPYQVVEYFTSRNIRPNLPLVHHADFDADDDENSQCKEDTTKSKDNEVSISTFAMSLLQRGFCEYRRCLCAS